AMTFSATASIRSTVPTEVPPYFWTSKAIITDVKKRSADYRKIALECITNLYNSISVIEFHKFISIFQNLSRFTYDVLSWLDSSWFLNKA
ncbi:MAG: hypothetical protein ACI8XC_003618, partial [Gammaproteobacteria bacterium]